MNIENKQPIPLSKSVEAGLREFKTKLVIDMVCGENEIGLAIKKDRLPRRSISEKIVGFVIGSEEKKVRSLWDKEIAKERAIIKAIDDENVDVVTEFLIGEIGTQIRDARVGIFSLGDKFEDGKFLVDSIQEDINILNKIDPEKAQEWQEILNRETGDSTEKTE